MGRVMVNYHPRAAQKFLEHVASPPKSMTKQQQAALNHVRDILLKRATTAAPSAP
jgi:hypothetical protein